ncbi:MAG: branched-chain amino acid transaminase [archaeon]
MQESEFIWMNGQTVPWKESNSHFLSHALHYGSAVFEGIRCYNTPKGPAVFRLDEHVKRLFNSAKIFGMTIPFEEKEIFSGITEIVSKNNLNECYIRPLAYYGYGGLGFDVSNQKVDVGIAAWSWGAMLGAESVAKGISIKISPFLRPSSEYMPVTAKVSGNYANSIMAKMDAIRNGYDDVVMLDRNGNVAECSAENFFMIKNGVVITPTKDNCLEGITRKSIMEIALDKGWRVEEKSISPSEVFASDECFACGTAAEIVPITSIDHKPIGKGIPGGVTREIQQEYQKIIHGENEKYTNWLTLVK